MASSGFLKWMSLALLIAQTVGFGMTLRYARLCPGPRFSDLSAVICSEFVKLVASCAMIVAESGTNGLAQSLRHMFCDEPRSTALMGIPGVIYAAQNYLYFSGGSNLSVAMYQVAKQTAIPATAVMSVVCLGKHVDAGRWIALLVLTAGVAIITLHGDTVVSGNLTIGLSCVLVASVCSACASVCTEAMIKSERCTMWERNVQLSVFGILSGCLCLGTKGMGWFEPDVFFSGYGWQVWALVFIQSLGGLLTAAVLKYADSVMKCVAKATAVVAAATLSRVVFSEGPSLDTMQFQVGTIAVVFGATAYSLGFNKLRSRFCLKSEEQDARQNAGAIKVSAEVIGTSLDHGEDTTEMTVLVEDCDKEGGSLERDEHATEMSLSVTASTQV
mmetsp:Transcript_145720/g.466929  ORF Transcript_145720/g.466929 Transcript_145720/m.466929 type:complete len:387 (+) Transcript_145720:96-1256(+)